VLIPDELKPRVAELFGCLEAQVEIVGPVAMVVPNGFEVTGFNRVPGDPPLPSYLGSENKMFVFLNY
jgi:hypothetical protein